MKKFIVITTINQITEGIIKFKRFTDWEIIVVGDLKTPKYITHENLTYLSVDDQKSLKYNIYEVLPYNHYTRKNIGYLYAISQGATVIYDTDDDNIPYEGWGFELFNCKHRLDSDSRYVNVYRYFTNQHIWPRGFPLEYISKASVRSHLSDTVEIGVWQGLADRDPDVDAIYRMVVGAELVFDVKPSIYLGKGSYCPFNSQNTLWAESAFPLLYLPATVSFRYTDILRGYVAQRLLWENNHFVGFCSATVYQERNYHNLMNDFKEEIDCYLNTQPIIELIDRMDLRGDLYEALRTIYKNLSSEGYIDKHEMRILEAWLVDFVNLSRRV